MNGDNRCRPCIDTLLCSKEDRGFWERGVPMTLTEEDVFSSVFSEMPSGPGLALVLETQEPDQLDDFDVVELARSARRLASWAAAIELSAVAELSARRRAAGEKLGAWDSEVGEWVTDEVAAALT